MPADRAVGAVNSDCAVCCKTTNLQHMFVSDLCVLDEEDSHALGTSAHKAQGAFQSRLLVSFKNKA